MKLEQEIKDEADRRALTISLDDPAFDKKTAYWRGMSDMVTKLWIDRHRLRKGDEDADDETQKAYQKEKTINT